MVNSHFLKKIMVIGEQQMLKSMGDYLSLAKENSESLIKIFTAPENEIAELCNRIEKNEKDADEITLHVKRNITSGAIGASLMENFLTLAEKFDDVIDKTYWVAREMKRTKNSLISNSFHTEPLLAFYENFVKILSINIQATEEVKKLLEISDIDGIKKVRERIENFEENVDEIKDGVIDRLYRISESITYLMFNHVNSIVHVLDDLLDNYEDISDLILNTMLSVSK